MQDFSPNLNYYRPSGAAPIGGVLLTLALGVAAAFPIAFLYAFINHHDPILYLNILLAVGFGFVLGWVVSKGIHKFRIRNAFIALTIAVVVFAVAYVVHWFVYVSAVIVDWETDAPYDVLLIARYALDLFEAPGTFLEILKEMNHEGIWSISSSSGRSSATAVNGVFLTAIWIAEALVVFYNAVKKPLDETRKPYSERSEEWLKPQEMVLPIAFVANKAAFESSLARNDYSALTTPLPPLSGNEAEAQELNHATVTLYNDPFDPCITVSNVTVKQKKKKTDVSTKAVVRYLKVSPSVAQNIASALGAEEASQI